MTPPPMRGRDVRFHVASSFDVAGGDGDGEGDDPGDAEGEDAGEGEGDGEDAGVGDGEGTTFDALSGLLGSVWFVSTSDMSSIPSSSLSASLGSVS